jgi:hypothetical protein
MMTVKTSYPLKINHKGYVNKFTSRKTLVNKFTSRKSFANNITYCKSSFNKTNSTTKKNALNFNNWAPELINARCAMIGIVSGYGYELINDKTFTEQFIDLYPYFFVVSVLVTIGTLKAGKPILDKTNKNFIFTPEAELLNGRIAMIAFLSTVVNEYYLKTMM